MHAVHTIIAKCLCRTLIVFGSIFSSPHLSFTSLYLPLYLYREPIPSTPAGSYFAKNYIGMVLKRFNFRAQTAAEFTCADLHANEIICKWYLQGFIYIL